MSWQSHWTRSSGSSESGASKASMSRSPEHRQRMHATFGADGRTMTIESEARDAGTHEMRPDMSQILTRVA